MPEVSKFRDGANGCLEPIADLIGFVASGVVSEHFFATAMPIYLPYNVAIMHSSLNHLKMLGIHEACKQQ